MKKIFMYFLMVLSALSFSSCKIKPKENRTYPNFKAGYFDSGIMDEKDPNQRVYYIVACKGETYQVINDIKLDIQASLAPLHATTKEEDLEKYKNDVDKTTKIYIDTNNEKHKIHELPFLIVDTDYGSIHIDCRIKFNNTNTISIPREYFYGNEGKACIYVESTNNDGEIIFGGIDFQYLIEDNQIIFYSDVENRKEEYYKKDYA